MKRLQHIPRIFLIAIVWVFFTRIFRDVVPISWVLIGPLLAFAVTWVLLLNKFPMVSTLIILAILPWTLRILIQLTAFLWHVDFHVPLDRGWLLTAPFWYCIAVGTYMDARFPKYAYWETIILAVVAVVLMAPVLKSFSDLTGPQIEGLRLIIAVMLFAVSLLCFLSAALRIHPGRNYGGRPLGQLTYVLLLSVFIMALIVAGNYVRLEKAVSSGGGVLTSDLFRFDFSDVLSLEPQVKLNAELTLLYREDGIPVTRYLRRFTLSGWSEEKGFYRDADQELSYPGGPSLPTTVPAGPKEWPGPVHAMTRKIEQEYYLVALDPASLFVLDRPLRVEPWDIWDDASFVRAYAVESLVSEAGPWELDDASPDTLPTEYRNFLLRGGDDVYYKSWIPQILRDEKSSWAIASAIEQWLRNNYDYSLNPGLAPDGDQLAWFLNESQQGYCTYFAYAMTRLCRAAGVPTRIAVGFLTDPETTILGFTPVHSGQAHTWVEVWIEDYGWIIFDPTSQNMASGEDYPVQFLSPDEWLPLIEEVLTRRGEVSLAIQNEDVSDSSATWWSDFVQNLAGKSQLIRTVFLLILWLIYIPRRIWPGIMDLIRSQSSHSRRRVIARWRRFARRSIRSGMGVYESETPLEWAKRIKLDECFSQWTGVYLKAQFASHFGEEDVTEAWNYEQQCHAMWRKMPLRTRLCGIFSPGLAAIFPWRLQT